LLFMAEVTKLPFLRKYSISMKSSSCVPPTRGDDLCP
jgi:hypothetical protein